MAAEAGGAAAAGTGVVTGGWGGGSPLGRETREREGHCILGTLSKIVYSF